MRRLGRGEVELTDLERMLHTEFHHRLDRGQSIPEAVGGLVDELDAVSEHDTLHLKIAPEVFWRYLSDTDDVWTREGQLECGRWWVRVGEDAWRTISEVDRQAMIDAGTKFDCRPIYRWPTSGQVIYRTRGGDLMTFTIGSDAWVPTHRSVNDGSAVRQVQTDPFTVENEDGERWVDDPAAWTPVTEVSSDAARD